MANREKTISAEPVKKLRRDARPELRDPWRITAEDWAAIEAWAAEGRKRFAPDPSMAELQERARARLQRQAERDSAKRRARAEAERVRRWQASPRGKAEARGATFLQLVTAAMVPGRWHSLAEMREALPALSYGGIKATLMQKGRADGLIERALNADYDATQWATLIAVRWNKPAPKYLYRLTEAGERFRAAYLAKAAKENGGR